MCSATVSGRFAQERKLSHGYEEMWPAAVQMAAVSWTWLATDPPPDSTGISELRRLAERIFSVLQFATERSWSALSWVEFQLLRTEDLGSRSQQAQIFLRFQALLAPI